MAGYPQNQQNPSGYGQPYTPSPYGPPPPGPQPHGSQPQPYGAQQPPQSQSQSHAQSPYAPVATPYGAPSAPYAAPHGEKPHKDHNKPTNAGAPYGAPAAAPYGSPAAASYGSPAPQYGAPQPHSTGYPPAPTGAYGSPFASLVPSAFPPGTDPNVVSCFQMADRDGSGFIDDKELQSALSSYNQGFSLRTVHLLMYLFTNTNTRKIGPKEFTAVFYSLQSWRSNFEKFDRDRSGKIDASELREALASLGFSVSPGVLDLLVSKFDKSGGHHKAIEYDNFIECCLTVKGLTEKFKEKDTNYSGNATFTYESFMLTVLPFLIA